MTLRGKNAGTADVGLGRGKERLLTSDNSRDTSSEMIEKPDLGQQHKKSVSIPKKFPGAALRGKFF